jgi:outer membrane receptor protein involved in Fe transport
MNLIAIKPKLFALALLTTASSSTLLAQAAAPGTTAPKPAKPPEEVVTLSEFSVTADSERGYVASETLTGSRVRTPIIDLPYTVNVLTSEFFEDFAIFELADNLVHIGSFTSLDIGGGFTLRGFSATSQLRDGFYRLGRYGSSNVDRTEIIKGSNAAIYGRTSPGGMINMISKMPREREYYRLMLNYGDYHTRRGVFEATGPLFKSSLGKTSYILTLSQYERGFDQDYARNRNQEYYAAIKHSFGDGSILTLQGEFFHQMRHAPNSSAPLVTDLKGNTNAADDEAIGYAKNLADYNPGGPNSELNRGNTSFTATYEKRLNDVWSVRGSGSYFRARRWDFNAGGWGSITINNPTVASNYTTTRGATPTKGLIMEDGGGIQADLLAHYWLRNHTIENRTLATIDFNDYYRWDPTWNYGPATNADIRAWSTVPAGAPAGTLAPNVLRLNPDFTPATPIGYFPSFFQWGQETLNRLTRRRTTVLGGLVRHQAAFLQGRLLTYAGARFDAVRFQERDLRNTTAGDPGKVYLPGEMIYKRINQLKPNLGVNYKLTSNLRAFANYSESYFVNQTDNPDVFAVSTYKPEVANGYDYGFKGSFLQDRLTFTVSGFYAVRENVSVSQLVETPVGSGNFVTTNVRDGNQLVRGYEMDLNWRATDEVSVTGSWGHVYSVYTDFGSANPLAVGRRVNGVSPENGSLSMRYGPRAGALKGFSANLGVTYVASTPTEAPNAGDTYATGPGGVRTLTRTTYQWRLRVPSFMLWNAGVRYTFRPDTRFDHTLAVNVNNIFDRDYLKVNRNLGERRAVYLTYTLGYAGTRTSR